MSVKSVLGNSFQWLQMLFSPSSRIDLDFFPMAATTSANRSMYRYACDPVNQYRTAPGFEQMAVSCRRPAGPQAGWSLSWAVRLGRWFGGRCGFGDRSLLAGSQLGGKNATRKKKRRNNAAHALTSNL